jgi:hypothetical protein
MARAWGWRAGKLSRRVAARVCRHLYRDVAGGSERCILIAGTARSGTTWLADLIASQAPCRMMFEPFHRDKVGELADLKLFHYLRPDERHDVLEDFARRLFRGEIRHPWIDREVRRLRPRRRVIKEIRANLFLHWLHERFPEVRLLLVLRHPCAVVASRLALGWATDTDLDPFLAQPALGEHLPWEALERIRREGSNAAKHAAIWSVHYRVPLLQFAAGEIPAVFYERLVTEPHDEVPRVFAAAGFPHDDSVYRRLAVPSTTAVGHSAVTRGASPLDAWKGRLEPGRVDDVLRVVEAFGLGGIYDDSALPLRDDPWSVAR